MNATPSNRTSSRPGLGTRFRDWLRSWLFPLPYDGESSHTEITDPPFTFDTPALGDAYMFTVSVRLQWSALGTGPDSDLSGAIKRHRERVRWTVSDIVRGAAREFPPHTPQQAEAEIGRRLKTMRLPQEKDGTQVECTAFTRVGAPLPLVDQLQEIWSRRVADEERHESARRTAVRVRELRDVWRDFLSEGMDDWISPYAVGLAETPQDISSLMKQMLQERQEEAQRLLDMVDNVMTAQQRADVYDFVVSSETVLRHTLKMMGIPVPDPAPDSLFAADGLTGGTSR
ncbi:hypothetical protein [Microbispora sp. H13382]|uniref:hypothetical protein n=1 Tax=Microbispora sp. H13382 TaxID=2729112 RepID=UPI0016032CF8|nr:hypothetical protein [Microbispora sp. H13382]